MENLNENELLKQELEELKKELASLKPVILLPDKKKKPRGRPKLDPKDKVDRNVYMKNYMRNYNVVNKERELLRRNSYYYLKNTDMTQSFFDKHGLYSCLVYKARLELVKVKKNLPSIYFGCYYLMCLYSYSIN
jgi:hypothetical protein